MDQTTKIAVLIAAVAMFVTTPALIALARRHPERRTILALTPLAALSFLLWFALLVWAAGGKRDDGVIGRYADRIRRARGFPYLVGGLVVLGLAAGAVAMARG